jgi:hypothetical protein
MKHIYSTNHHPSPLLVEAMQREVLRNSRKFFNLFRERHAKKRPLVSRCTSPLVNCSRAKMNFIYFVRRENEPKTLRNDFFYNH